MTKLQTAAIVLVIGLFSVWPVPHTMLIRESLLFITAVMMGYLCYRNRTPSEIRWWRVLRAQWVLLAALTAWMLVVALFVSPETAWTLNEIRGQWLKPLLTLIAGGLTALAVAADDKRAARLLLLLGAVLFAHILVVSGEALMTVFAGATGFRAVGLTEGPDRANYLTNLMLALLFGETLLRTMRNTRLVPLPTPVLLLVFAVTLFSLYAEGVRNGLTVAVIMFLCWAALALWLWRPLVRRRWIQPTVLISLATIAVGLLVLAFNIKPGTTLRQFTATIPLALDTQAHKGWLNQSKYGLPELPGSYPIDSSAYLRIAWLKEGLVLSGEHPLGVGFGRNAFGHALLAKYGEPKSHSHSSVIDLLVGIGIPGLLLWFGFLASLLWLAFSGLKRMPVSWGAPLIFVVVDFAARSVVDSNTRDHMLQMFMFVVGLLVVLTVRQTTLAGRGASESLNSPF